MQFSILSSAYARGNNDVKLFCSGPREISITKMFNAGNHAKEEDVREFNKYCAKNSTKTSVGTKCLVSIQRVYNHPDIEESYTEIFYKCDERD